MDVQSLRHLQALRSFIGNLVDQAERAGGCDCHKPPSLLLVGPPGAGKTYLVKQMSNVCELPLYGVHTNQVRSPAAVRKLFEQAREHYPSLVFMDDVDAIMSDHNATPACSPVVKQLRDELFTQLGSRKLQIIDPNANKNPTNSPVSKQIRSRSNSRASTMTRTSPSAARDEEDIDDDDSYPDNNGIIVVAATSAPWLLYKDHELLSRFRGVYLVGLPDKQTRYNLLKTLFNDVHHNLTDKDIMMVAEKTEGFTPADLMVVLKTLSYRQFSFLLSMTQGGHESDGHSGSSDVGSSGSQTPISSDMSETDSDSDLDGLPESEGHLKRGVSRAAAVGGLGRINGGPQGPSVRMNRAPASVPGAPRAGGGVGGAAATAVALAAMAAASGAVPKKEQPKVITTTAPSQQQGPKPPVGNSLPVKSAAATAGVAVGTAAAVAAAAAASISTLEKDWETDSEEEEEMDSPPQSPKSHREEVQDETLNETPTVEESEDEKITRDDLNVPSPDSAIGLSKSTEEIVPIRKANLDEPDLPIRTPSESSSSSGVASSGCDSSDNSAIVEEVTVPNSSLPRNSDSETECSEKWEDRTSENTVLEINPLEKGCEVKNEIVVPKDETSLPETVIPNSETSELTSEAINNKTESTTVPDSIAALEEDWDTDSEDEDESESESESEMEIKVNVEEKDLEKEEVIVAATTLEIENTPVSVEKTSNSVEEEEEIKPPGTPVEFELHYSEPPEPMRDDNMAVDSDSDNDVSTLPRREMRRVNFSGMSSLEPLSVDIGGMGGGGGPPNVSLDDIPPNISLGPSNLPQPMLAEDRHQEAAPNAILLSLLSRSSNNSRSDRHNNNNIDNYDSGSGSDLDMSEGLGGRLGRRSSPVGMGGGSSDGEMDEGLGSRFGRGSGGMIGERRGRLGGRSSPVGMGSDVLEMAEGLLGRLSGPGDGDDMVDGLTSRLGGRVSPLGMDGGSSDIMGLVGAGIGGVVSSMGRDRGMCIGGGGGRTSGMGLGAGGTGVGLGETISRGMGGAARAVGMASGLVGASGLGIGGGAGGPIGGGVSRDNRGGVVSRGNMEGRDSGIGGILSRVSGVERSDSVMGRSRSGIERPESGMGMGLGGGGGMGLSPRMHHDLDVINSVVKKTSTPIKAMGPGGSLPLSVTPDLTPNMSPNVTPNMTPNMSRSVTPNMSPSITPNITPTPSEGSSHGGTVGSSGSGTHASTVSTNSHTPNKKDDSDSSFETSEGRTNASDVSTATCNETGETMECRSDSEERLQGLDVPLNGMQHSAHTTDDEADSTAAKTIAAAGLSSILNLDDLGEISIQVITLADVLDVVAKGYRSVTDEEVKRYTDFMVWFSNVAKSACPHSKDGSKSPNSQPLDDISVDSTIYDTPSMLKKRKGPLRKLGRFLLKALMFILD